MSRGILGGILGTGNQEAVSTADPLGSAHHEAWSNGLKVNGDAGGALGAGGVDGAGAGAGVGAGGVAVRCEPGVMLPSQPVNPVSRPGRWNSDEATSVGVIELRSLGEPDEPANNVASVAPWNRANCTAGELR